MASLLRKLLFVLAGLSVLFACTVLYVDGHLPSSVPDEAPEYAVTEFASVLNAVDSRGQVDLAQLKANHAKLERFIESMAKYSPDTTPERFGAVEARVTYWLNAYHALVLAELMETRSNSTSWTGEVLRATPIGGKRMTRMAIYRQYLSQSGDARLFLCIFTGAKGRGVLDGAPFSHDTLNSQLDDAVRRFVRRKSNFSIEGTTVKMSKLFELHRDDFLSALPDERKNVLQIVWAYLPDACDEGSPGCETRTDLDRACGNRFDKCSVTYLPIDETLAVKN
ncbi:MAG: DUF547 domain-containing protein [Archangium sp.]